MACTDAPAYPRSAKIFSATRSSLRFVLGPALSIDLPDGRVGREKRQTETQAAKVAGRILFYCRVRHLHAVELVALRRVAPRRAAQRPSGAAHSIRSTRTGLSQRDEHHPQEIELRSKSMRNAEFSMHPIVRWAIASPGSAGILPAPGLAVSRETRRQDAGAPS